MYLEFSKFKKTPTFIRMDVRQINLSENEIRELSLAINGGSNNKLMSDKVLQPEVINNYGHINQNMDFMLAEPDNKTIPTYKVAFTPAVDNLNIEFPEEVTLVNPTTFKKDTTYYVKIEGGLATIYGEDILTKTVVVNNFTSTDGNKALSAAKGKELNDRLNNLSAVGRFLSVWDCSTGLPQTNPTELPYTYHTGDYYRIGVIGETNYYPTGSQYTGEASTTVTLTSLAVGDIIYYDGTNWIRQTFSNSTPVMTELPVSGVLSENTIYNLGTISSLSYTLPAAGNFDKYILIIFTASGVFTPTEIVPSGQTPAVNDIIEPTINNKTYELLFSWNGSKYVKSTLYY